MLFRSGNLPLPVTAVENDTTDNVSSMAAQGKTVSTMSTHLLLTLTRIVLFLLAVGSIIVIRVLA